MRTLRKKWVSLMLIFTILIAVFMPTIVNAAESSRVQIIMSESAGNNYGTYNISGGSFGVTMNLDGPRAEFVDIGTEIILSVTPDQYHTFKGWYLAEEYEIVAGLMGWRPINENNPLSTNETYTFTVTEGYYNIMPVFESKVGHNNIWTTSGGQVTVLYENRDEQEQPRLDGNHWGTGEVVDYLKGDSITVKAQANENYKFVGWYVSNVQKGPEYYDGNKLVTESSNYTYTPGETRITGIDEPINYITAVFKNRITKVDEFVATSTETEVLSEDEDLEEYINRNLWDISAKNSELNNRWLALFGEVDGVYKYPKHGGVTYVFLNSTTENGVIVNHYRVEYDEVIVVTKAATPVDPSLDEPETTEYTILEGSNQTYTLGSNKDIVITASGDIDKITAIEIDNGNVIDTSNYELAQGSTKLTLKSSFLENTSLGEHTITFKYNDGEVSTKLTIAKANNTSPTTEDTTSENTTTEKVKSSNPQTGDNIIMIISIFAIATFGVFTTLKVNKNRRVRKH